MTLPTHRLHLTMPEYVALLRAYASKEGACSADEAARFALQSTLTPEEFGTLPKRGVFVDIKVTAEPPLPRLVQEARQ